MIGNIKKSVMTLEISVPSPEVFLNLLWRKKINVMKVVRRDITTIRFIVSYKDYKDIQGIVKLSKGKMKVVDKKGGIFLLRRFKNGAVLALGSIIFIIFLYILSTFVWAIEINTGENVSPYEIRRNLKEIGIEPGINKEDLDVYDLEKKIEGLNSSILWIRARIEGSTLKIVIKEKVNPPVKSETNLGDCTALTYGEIKRIFVASGTPAVSVGDFVREGDVLIRGMQGSEGKEYQVPAKGIIIANTFYEREIEVLINGKTLSKTDKKDSDIYIKIFEMKIYFKKAINNFEYYDKIDSSGSIFNKVTYFEKKEVQLKEDKEAATMKATSLLEESLRRNLTNTAKIIKRDVFVKDIDGGKIRIRVTFVVEQDIAHTIT